MTYTVSGGALNSTQSNPYVVQGDTIIFTLIYHTGSIINIEKP